jgi:hypothetical protein
VAILGRTWPRVRVGTPPPIFHPKPLPAPNVNPFLRASIRKRRQIVAGWHPPRSGWHGRQKPSPPTGWRSRWFGCWAPAKSGPTLAAWLNQRIDIGDRADAFTTSARSPATRPRPWSGNMPRTSAPRRSRSANSSPRPRHKKRTEVTNRPRKSDKSSFEQERRFRLKTAVCLGFGMVGAVGLEPTTR